MSISVHGEKELEAVEVMASLHQQIKTDPINNVNCSDKLIISYSYR